MLLNLLLASGANITPDAILNHNLLEHWHRIQTKMIVEKFTPVLGPVERFADECQQLHHLLALPKNTMDFDWNALEKLDAVQAQIGTTPYTVDFGKLLKYFDEKHACMLAMNGKHKPNVSGMEKENIVLRRILSRISDAHSIIDSIDKYDSTQSTIDSGNFSNDGKQSVDTQLLMAMMPTTPVINTVRAKVQHPYRISLIDDFYPIQEHKAEIESILTR